MTVSWLKEVGAFLSSEDLVRVSRASDVFAGEK